MNTGIYECKTCHATQLDRDEDSNICQYCGGIKERIVKQVNTKPPLGIEPRWIHDSLRLNALVDAIYRYINTGKEIPIEWIEEFNDLVVKQLQRQENPFGIYKTTGCIGI